MVDLSDFARLVAIENGLSVISAHRPDGTIHSSVVNAGVLADPENTSTSSASSPSQDR